MLGVIKLIQNFLNINILNGNYITYDMMYIYIFFKCILLNIIHHQDNVIFIM